MCNNIQLSKVDPLRGYQIAFASPTEVLLDRTDRLEPLTDITPAILGTFAPLILVGLVPGLIPLNNGEPSGSPYSSWAGFFTSPS